MNEADAPLELKPVIVRLFRLGLRHWIAFGIMILCMAFMGLVSGVLVIAFQDVLAFFGLNKELSDTAATEVIENLNKTASWILYLAPFAAFAAFTSWYASQWVANRTMADLRRDVLEHLLHLDLRFHTDMAKGDLMARMSGDMERTQGLLQSLYGKVQQRPWEILGTIAALFATDWRLSLLFFCGIAPILAILSVVFKSIRKRSVRARSALTSLLVIFEQLTSGIRVIKSSNSQDRELIRFDDYNHNLLRNNMKLAQSRASADSISYGLIPLIMGGLFLSGPWLISHGVSPVTLGVFLAALMRMLQLIRTLQREWSGIVETAPCAARVFQVLDRHSDIKDKDNATKCPAPKHAIHLDKVSFSYNNEQPVLDKLSLEIPVGKTVALVGESGAGKSTILDLLPRFYDVTDGAILFDTTDIRNVQHRSLIQHFSIVQQESFLFNDTIAANIAYGREDATQKEIEEAARKAHIHETILSFEGAYNFIVGERGERLSGGQRQRIAIARAFLRNAAILILDEPTSALDAESERNVQEALDELLKNRTCIVVAHRLSTIQNADCIYLLGVNGKIIESGNHEELLQNNGPYAELVQLQQLREGD